TLLLTFLGACAGGGKLLLNQIQKSLDARFASQDQARLANHEQRRRQKLSATPDLSGTVLPLCHIPNSALKNAPPSKSATPRASA
ncbi:hypothetical protein JTM39_38415, partial [Pseudomonas aeruginosa]|nr:hypothetical protein [Pseudomonas aeruginosa]